MSGWQEIQKGSGWDFIPSQIMWHELKCYDDIFSENEKRIIEEIEAKSPVRCPVLRRNGRFFHYCGIGLPERMEPKLDLFDPMYQKHKGILEIQIFCMDHERNFENCIFYNEKKIITP